MSPHRLGATRRCMARLASCTFAVLAALAINVHAAQAAPVEAAEPPTSNMTGEDYARLMARRKSLDESRYALEQDLAALNSDCSRVPASDSARVGHCRSRQQELLARLRAYKDALAAYRQEISAAQRRAAGFERLDQEIRADNGRLVSQMQRLMIEADNIFVPPPAGERRVHEGVLLGLFDDDRDVMELLNGVVSPFSGRRYAAGEVRPTTDAATAHEAIRGLLDNHYLGAYTLSGEYGRRLMANIGGTHYGRLLAHSNGATIAEALIRRDVIEVDELNILGGDRSMVNAKGLQELIDSGQVKRVVWINPGDIIPVGSSATYLSPFGPTGSFPLATTAQYFARRLTGDLKGGDIQVEYRVLEGPHYEGQTLKPGGIFDSHALDVYLRNMQKYLENSNGR